MEFILGDKVLCLVNTRSAFPLVKGKIYTISKVEHHLYNGIPYGLSLLECPPYLPQGWHYDNFINLGQNTEISDFERLIWGVE